MLCNYILASMRSLSKNNPVRIIRGICHLTQAELAKLIGCARLTVLTLESGRLKLSEKMAERISLHTGVSKTWLLSNDHKRDPICERDPQKPYTIDVFMMTRAEVSNPRLHPLDVRHIENVLASAYARLSDAARQAYSADKIVYFYYLLREFLSQVDDRWPDSGELARIMDAAQIASRSKVLFEKVRKEKETAALRNPTGATRVKLGKPSP